MKHRHSFVGQGYMLPFVLITFFFFFNCNPFIDEIWLKA